MRQANKLEARFCLLLGSEEVAQKRVTVKNMATGEQSTVTESAVAALLQPNDHKR
jgi:histidyl-tRNA synthetase